MKSNKDKLAILGGDPVRVIPYPKHSTMIDEKEEKLVLDLLRDGELSGFSGRPGDRFLGGKYVKDMEARAKEIFDVKHVISFNSATSAAHAAVSSAGIGPGDEVITSPFTMSATASAILMQGAVPVFADIEDVTYGLDPESVKNKITPRTKGILAVNIFGHPARLHELKKIADEHGIELMEDNAQSPTAKYKDTMAGKVGSIGILSLNYHKVIQTGEGGMALTNDDDFALHMQLKRNHGEVTVGKIDKENMLNQLGFNYRLPELCAAVGVAQLDKLKYLAKHRVNLALYLSKLLAEIDFLEPPRIEDDCEHVFYLFAMRFNEKIAGFTRNEFALAMKAEGVSILEGYMNPLYLEPIYQNFKAYGDGKFPFDYNDIAVDYTKGICPVAERMWESDLLITDICKYPNTVETVDEYLTAIKKVAAGLRDEK